MLQVLLDIMEARQEMLATMQRATVAESQVFQETTSPLLCSSVDFLGFTNSFVEMLEDEIQAKVSLFFFGPPARVLPVSAAQDWISLGNNRRQWCLTCSRNRRMWNSRL